MRTDRAQARLSAYMEGDVSSREAARIEAALEASAELREELRILQGTVSLLRGLPRSETPPALADRVMERVRAGEAEPVRWRDGLYRLFEPAFAVPLAASAAALLVFVGTPTGGLLEEDSLPNVTVAALDPSAPVASVPVASKTPGVRNVNRVGPRMPQSQRVQMMRMLRGAGHPHSAALASQMEPDGDIVLAGFSKGGRGR